MWVGFVWETRRERRGGFAGVMDCTCRDEMSKEMMMMTFITRRGEGQGKTKKEREATKSKGRGLEEGASRALMRQHGEGGCGARG